MGSMSASDAAPLPRLGEVYFDVRGESRSMRLSWYADTGVAVFSIWQGGTCTGTFRLPIADLPRMVEALQRGPHGAARDPRELAGTAEQRGRADQRGGPLPEPDTGYSDPGFPAAYTDHQPGYGEEPPREYLDPPGRGYRGEPATAGYREDQGGEHRRAGAHGRYDAPGEYEDEPTGVYRGEAAGHGYQDEPGARYREADYTGDPLTGRYPVAEPHPSRYPEEDPHQPRYQDDPFTGRYHEDPRESRYPEEDPRQSRYPEEDPRRARYSEDPLTGAYPDDPHTGNAGYSPARPYVAPVPGSTGPAAEGRDHGRRRAADREEDDLSPGSFPYGRPPAEPEPPRRGR
jgi:hypothetical protein